MTAGWQVWAFGAAAFAALTAIFAKVGVEGVPSDYATLIRTIFILALVAGIVAVTGEYKPLHEISGRTLVFLVAVRPRDGSVVALLFPCPETCGRQPCRSGRQAQRRACRCVRGAVSGGTAGSQGLAWRRPDLRGRAAGDGPKVRAVFRCHATRMSVSTSGSLSQRTRFRPAALAA